MNDKVTKNDWLLAQECMGMAWLTTRAEPTAPDEASRFRMEQGQEIGALARKMYPGGILVTPHDGKTVYETTGELIADPGISTLHEAAFTSGPFVAKADILQRDGDSWHVLEVKSSFSDTASMAELIDDLAYTVMVIGKSGEKVSRASLVLLSRTYRFGGAPNQLFTILDKTAEVKARVTGFEANADALAKELLGDIRPRPGASSACRNCAFFKSECIGSGIEHTVFEIPSLHYKKLQKLIAAGILDLSKVPDDIGLNPNQDRAKQSALSGKTLVDSGLKAVLDAIQWPCYYLDFETVQTFLPLYANHGCHRPVLTQFSIHGRDKVGGELLHAEFLADASKDCEREAAEALIDALGNTGTIFTYSSYEATRIKELKASFPDLATPLDAILARLTDLLKIVREHIYHPAFEGSFSIKKVLPALVTDLSYEGLEIANGDTAITRFARMARGEVKDAEIDATRKELLEYCATDTLAMVKVHEVLIDLAG